MKNYDNNIEMFDAYLNGTMSEGDKAAFEKMLSDDKSLRQEFKEHREILCAIQSTCSDADAEFEKALKGISDEEMKSIVSAGNNQTSSLAETHEKPKMKMVPLKSVIRWMSAAAAIVLVAGVGLNMLHKRQAKNMMCDAIAMTHDFESGAIALTRDGDEPNPEIQEYDKAIVLLKDSKADQAIDILKKLYTSTKDDDLKLSFGTSLAFAYVKAHDIDKAREIIKELRKFNGGIAPADLENLEKTLDNYN